MIARLEATLTSDVHETGLYGTVNTIDAVVVIDLSALGDVALLDAQTLADPDIHAKKTLTDKERVGLTPNDSVRTADGVTSVTLPPVSWTALSFG